MLGAQISATAAGATADATTTASTNAGVQNAVVSIADAVLSSSNESTTTIITSETGVDSRTSPVWALRRCWLAMPVRNPPAIFPHREGYYVRSVPPIPK